MSTWSLVGIMWGGGKAGHFFPIINVALQINSWDSVDKLLIPVNEKENKNQRTKER